MPDAPNNFDRTISLTKSLKPESKRKPGELLQLGRDQLFGGTPAKGNRLAQSEAQPVNPRPQSSSSMGGPAPDTTPVPVSPRPEKKKNPLEQPFQKTDQAPDPVHEAFQVWRQTPSPENLQKVVQSATGVLSRAAVTYAGADSPLVRSRARILAARAVKTYDPANASSLKSWIMTNLQGLTRYRQQLSPIRMPERVSYDLAHLHRTSREMEDELGRTPTDAELSDASGLSMKRIKHIREYNTQQKSESEMVDETGATYLPGVPDHSKEALWAQYVYHDLDPTNQRLYDMLLGRNGPVHTTSEAAKKLGISAAAVSQRAERIARMLEAGTKYTQ